MSTAALLFSPLGSAPEHIIPSPRRTGDNVRKQPSNSAEQTMRASSLLQVQKAHGPPSARENETIATAFF